ncbi:helix-turn-helix domain-containing protein [Tomitella gaofuii]|uniref:helix-turn-helix domain-containing protein n=1 Tax=Tomitella gaofuii TaxID=2760083 RepID=UPI0015FD6975|nr:helix-turn-helix transcriptional regulator [Tomitella gaofuii]
MATRTPEFGEWISRRLEERGWDSLKAAGEQFGVSHTTVRDWRDGVVPRPATMRTIADTLGCSIVDVFVAAGWVSESEASMRVTHRPMADVSGEELAREVTRRLTGQDATPVFREDQELAARKTSKR